MAKDGASSEAATPRLRFPEFVGTAGWHELPLRELGEIVTGKTPSTKDDELWGGSIPFITPTDIREDAKYQQSTQRTIIESKGVKLLPPGSIVYTCIASIGKMAMTKAISATNQQINAIVPNGRVNGEFAYYALAHLTPQIKSTPATSTLPIINKAEFSAITIPSPVSLAEQQKIADCLTSLDELIAAQGRKVAALGAHKRGLMQQLFPREGETRPRFRFPEFEDAADWEEVQLGECFSHIRNGFVGTATPFYVEDGIAYLQGKNVKKGRIDPTGLVTISGAFHEKQSKSQLKIGDIVMVQSGHVGECAVIDEDFDGANCHALIIMSPEPQLHSSFFVQCFSSDYGVKLVKQITTGNTVKHILASDMRAMTVLTPKFAEQERIADCLSALDARLAAESARQERLRAHKKGLMQRLFPAAQG